MRSCDLSGCAVIYNNINKYYERIRPTLNGNDFVFFFDCVIKCPLASIESVAEVCNLLGSRTSIEIDHLCPLLFFVLINVIAKEGSIMTSFLCFVTYYSIKCIKECIQ